MLWCHASMKKSVVGSVSVYIHVHQVALYGFYDVQLWLCGSACVMHAAEQVVNLSQPCFSCVAKCICKQRDHDSDIRLTRQRGRGTVRRSVAVCINLSHSRSYWQPHAAMYEHWWWQILNHMSELLVTSSCKRLRTVDIVYARENMHKSHSVLSLRHCGDDDALR